MKIINAYESLHASGILHIDVKRRYLLTDGRNIRLIDFGSSITVQEGAARLTTGSFSKLYGAPELFNSSSVVTNATDYYGLGLVLQYMVYDVCGIDEDVIDYLVYKPKDGVEDRKMLYQGFEGCREFRLSESYKELSWNLIRAMPEDRVISDISWIGGHNFEVRGPSKVKE